MKIESKETYLQLRITPSQKRAIARLAKRANVGMSEWVLNKIFPSQREIFNDLTAQLKDDSKPQYILAQIHDLLLSLSGEEFLLTTGSFHAALEPYWANYLAAMVEHSANQKGVPAPMWTRDIPPLESPVFGSDLKNLRLYLLSASPPSFRNRNIFIDATIGDRV